MAPQPHRPEMQQDSQQKTNVDRFIMNRMDTVPHLEALLLLWRERPRLWSVESVAERLWVKPPRSHESALVRLVPS